MKTAEQWLMEQPDEGASFKKHKAWLSECRLEAYKAGLEQAANLVCTHEYPTSPSILIREFSDKLTELP